MDAVQLRNITFLMSLGGLSTACFSDGGLTTGGLGTTGSTGDTTGPGTAGTDTTSATSQPTSTTSGDTDTTSTSTGGPVTASTTTTGLTTTAPDTTTTGPPQDYAVCHDYAGILTYCSPGAFQYDYLVYYCNNVITNGAALDGPACTDALEDWFACIADLDCAEIDPEFEMPTHCAVQGEAIDANCPDLNF